jgi:hypothetical protein
MRLKIQRVLAPARNLSAALKPPIMARCSWMRSTTFRRTAAQTLRVLQEHEFARLGSARTIRANVLLIAATHRDMAQ